MKRSTANIVLLVADISAIAALYFYTYKPLSEVLRSIANHEEFIRYHSTLYIVFGVALIPVAHAISLIETYFPQYFNRTICTIAVYGILAIILLTGLGTARWVKREIVRNGYLHCENADVHRKLLQIRAYVTDGDTCHRLILEEENRRLGYR